MTRKNAFFAGWSRLKSIILDWHKDKLEVLHQFGKRVNTKSQKVFEPNSYVCRSYRRKAGREGILNRVNTRVTHHIRSNALLRLSMYMYSSLFIIIIYTSWHLNILLLFEFKYEYFLMNKTGGCSFFNEKFS